MMTESRDRIHAKFLQFGGKMKGNILLDAASRRKIVLIDGYDYFNPADFKGGLPRHNEEWICEVVSESKSEDPFSGALRVKLVTPLKLELPTACGGRLIVPRDALQRLRAQPEVINLLGKAAGRLELPTDGQPLAKEIDLGRKLGRRRVVETPEVEIDQPCLFAQRIGRGRPSRVVTGKQGEMTNVISLRAEAVGCVATYRLKTASLGKLAPREPWSAMRNESELKYDSLPFWMCHAYVYDPRTMIGEPFTSTWEEIMRPDAPFSRSGQRWPQYTVSPASETYM
jgi:hypothetical protein